MQLSHNLKNDILINLLEIVNTNIRETHGTPVIYLEGGHFDPRYLVTDFAINSLHYALRVATQTISEHKKRVRLALGILIDDLGLQCGTEVCEIVPGITNKTTVADGEIPAELEEILAQYPIVKRDRLIVQGERTCKNRGIQTLKKLVAQHTSLRFPELEIEDNDVMQKIIFRNERSQRVLLAESKSKEVWIAKCPVIMAQHYSDVVKNLEKLHPQTNEIHIIDFSESDDYNKVINGSELAVKLFIQSKNITITNIFFSSFDDDEFIVHSVSNEISNFVA